MQSSPLDVTPHFSIGPAATQSRTREKCCLVFLRRQMEAGKTQLLGPSLGYTRHVHTQARFSVSTWR